MTQKNLPRVSQVMTKPQSAVLIARVLTSVGTALGVGYFLEMKYGAGGVALGLIAGMVVLLVSQGPRTNREAGSLSPPPESL